MEADLLDGSLQGDKGLVGDDRLQGNPVLFAFGAPFQNFILFFQLRVADGELDHEAVELGLGEREGAFVFDGVLGGDHDEWRGQGQAFAFEGDLVFLHGFQQGGLGFRRGPVDLVGQ